MAEVSVTINRRQYRLACEDGQEDHLMRLGEQLAARIEQLRGSYGEIGDTRLTVMAALTIADELSEAGQKIKRVEEELNALQDARAVSADHVHATQAAIAATLNSAAERIEGLTHKLNETLGDERVGLG